MREIKFRGLYTSHLISPNIWVYDVHGVDLGDNPIHQIEVADANEHRVYNVEPDSVGQFTGIQI